MTDINHVTETEGDLDAFLGARPRRRVAHWASLVALLLAAGAALWLLLRFVNGPDLPYYSVPLERGDLTPMMSAPGMIHAEDEIVLRASEDGTVRSLLGPGDGVVRAGQPIVVLDGAPFQAALAGAGASRAAAQAALVAAQAQLDNARARLDRYENVWRRSQGRVPSANEMDGARAEMMRAVAGLDSAKAGLALAQEQEKQARARLDAAIVRAPFDGLVVARAVAPGQIVRPGTPLLTLATGLDRLVVSVPLRADEAQRLAPSAKARVLLADTPDHVRSARLVRIEARADTHGQDRLAVFALDPPAPDAAQSGESGGEEALKVRPGIAATVEIELPAREGVLLVPNAALGFTPDGVAPRAGTIYVLAGKDDPRQVAVSTGVSDGRRTEILANGLEPGVQVITGRRAPTASLQGATGPDAKSGKP